MTKYLLGYSHNEHLDIENSYLEENEHNCRFYTYEQRIKTSEALKYSLLKRCHRAIR